jgi:hypothetical protein
MQGTQARSMITFHEAQAITGRPRERSILGTRVMSDIRNCEQCSALFVPRREHARFCPAACRVAWNREHTGDLKAGANALVWSITAMSDSTGRLPEVRRRTGRGRSR